MNHRELLRVALRALRAHKMRSFLTLLGVIIGVMTVVGVVGVIAGLDTFVKEKIIVMSPDVFIIQRFGIIRSREEFLQALKRPPMGFEDYQRLANADLPNVAMVGVGAARPIKANNGARHLDDAVLVGTTQRTSTMFNWDFTLESGRWFSEEEDMSAQMVAVIGANVKDEIFPGLEATGRTVLLKGLPFKVLGVIPKQGRSIGFNQDQRIYIPVQVYRKNFASSNEDFELYVKARGGVQNVDVAVDEVRTFFRALRHTSFRGGDPFGIITQESLQDLWRQISAAAFILMALVASVSLGVGGIVIMNIMLVSVTERTPEIGIRMAIGARKRDIRRQFLLEAALLSLTGGVIGVMLGSLAAFLVKALAGFPASVTPFIVLLGIGLSMVVGLAAGFLPARRASNLVVIDAIRAE